MGTSPFYLSFGLFFRSSRSRLFDFLRRREERILFRRQEQARRPGPGGGGGGGQGRLREGAPRCRYEDFSSAFAQPKC